MPSAQAGGPPPAPRVMECIAQEDRPVDLDFLQAECAADADLLSAAVFVLRAGQTERDLDAYLALFDADATITYGRRESAEAYDVTADRAHFEARLRAMAADSEGDSSVEVTFDGVRVELEGDHARVRAFVAYAAGSGEDVSLEGQSVDLRRSGEDWRVVSMRLWSRGWGIEDESATYDDAYWLARDRAVDAARAALATAGGTESARAHRRLRHALLEARQLPEALTIAREMTAVPAPTMTDWREREAAAAAMLEVEEARAAHEHIASAAVPDVSEPMYRELSRGDDHGYAAFREREAAQADVQDGRETDEEEREEEEANEPCDYDVVARLDGHEAGNAIRAVAIVHITAGAEEAERHFLLIGGETGWFLGPEIADGPFNGNQSTGTLSFEASAAELRQVEPGGAEELVLRYDTVFLPPDADETEESVEIHERGFLVCGGLAGVPRCVRAPDWVSRERRIGPATTATALVTFGADGSIRTARRTGRDPRIAPGTHTLRELLDAAPSDGGDEDGEE